jgi:hypothetical protein
MQLFIVESIRRFIHDEVLVHFIRGESFRRTLRDSAPEYFTDGVLENIPLVSAPPSSVQAQQRSVRCGRWLHMLESRPSPFSASPDLLIQQIVD